MGPLYRFSNAFDVIDHAISIIKFIALGLPSDINNWNIWFLSERKRICIIKLDIPKSGTYKHEYHARLWCWSNSLCINKSIIQGSGVGPILYV